MCFGILGRGFGLYGYLPAIASRSDAQITTLQSYRGTIESRRDLRHLLGRLNFVDTREDLLTKCDTLVVALRPTDQEALVEHLLAIKWHGALILEKPVAPTPDRTLRLLDKLIHSDITFRIGFSFHLTEWFSNLASLLAKGNDSVFRIEIKWLFRAHHYINNLNVWKRYCSEGGGALRYFGIHLIAAMARLPEWEIMTCDRGINHFDEEQECRFIITSGKTKVSILCNTNWSSQPEFGVIGVDGDNEIFSTFLSDPFSRSELSHVSSNAEKLVELEDQRVSYARGVLDSLATDSALEYQTYLRHARLWHAIESAAIRE